MRRLSKPDSMSALSLRAQTALAGVVVVSLLTPWTPPPQRGPQSEGAQLVSAPHMTERELQDNVIDAAFRNRKQGRLLAAG